MTTFIHYFFAFLLFTSNLIASVAFAADRGKAVTEKNNKDDWHNKGYIVNSTYPKAGMFAVAHLVLGSLHLWDRGFYEQQIGGFKIDFGTTGCYYDPSVGPNWWEYYFEPISVGTATRYEATTHDTNMKAWLARRKLTKQQAHETIAKYIKVRSHIIEKVEEFVEEQFSGHYVIGVHYRGTDKKLEADVVPYEEVFEAIRKQIAMAADPSYVIFVATDEELFIKKIQRIFPDKIISTDAIRSHNKKNIHNSGSEPYLLGEQALVDALLLSRTNVLIRTSSNLSLWSTYWNPDLPVIKLNSRFEVPEE